MLFNSNDVFYKRTNNCYGKELKNKNNNKKVQFKVIVGQFLISKWHWVGSASTWRLVKTEQFINLTEMTDGGIVNEHNGQLSMLIEVR